MITPLGQRQVLTTAAMEAVRVAHEGAVQSQQVESRRQAFVNRQAEGQYEVPGIEESDSLRLDPEGERGGEREVGEETPGQPGSQAQKDESEDKEAAGTAEGRLDFLA